VFVRIYTIAAFLGHGPAGVDVERSSRMAAGGVAVWAQIIDKTGSLLDRLCLHVTLPE
jgi:hypothetical protein